MPPDELVALVVEKRLAGALDTIDLSNRRLREIPEEIVDVIKDEAVRLALAYNQIHTIPARFTQLHRLRYLNLRSNAISIFPEWLGDMPRLEILDVSKNKLRRLPDDPRQLLQLRVFSVGQNRLRRLPLWLADMEHVRVLKIEENPLQWPPPHVAIAPAPAPALAAGATVDADEEKRRKKLEETQHRQWIAALKRWIGENAASERARDDGEDILQHHTRSQASTTSISDAPTPPLMMRSLPAESTDSTGTMSVASNQHSITSPNDSMDSNIVSPNTSGFSAARSSPERGFKIRPLMLARQPSLAGSKTSTNAAMTPNSSFGAGTAAGPSGLSAGTSVEELDAGQGSRVRGGREDGPSASVDGMPASSASLMPSSARSITPTPPREPRPEPSRLHSEPTPPREPAQLQPALELQRVESDGPAFGNPRPAPQPPPPAPASSSPVFRPRGASLHGRTNSHSMAPSPSSQSNSSSPSAPTARKRMLKTKKSLPDMRLGGATRDVGSNPELSSAADATRMRNRSFSIGGNSASGNVLTRPLLNHASTADVVPAMPRRPLPPPDIVEPSSPDAVRPAPFSTPSPQTIVRKPSARRAALLEAVGIAGHEEELDTRMQRDSYFKRLSTVRLSAIEVDGSGDDGGGEKSGATGSVAPSSTSVTPQPTPKTIDAARGILFALSQIFSALKQYTLFATDVVITEQLEPVLAVAGGTLEALIRALDRFDARPGDESAIDAVLEASRESVDTFRKVVSVLKLLLRPLQKDADVRYTRTLVLMLYGATVEVSNAWQDCLSGAAREEATNGRGVRAARGGRPAPLNVVAASNVGVVNAGALPSIAESLSPITPATPYTDMRSQRKRYEGAGGSLSAQDSHDGRMPPAMAGGAGTTSAPAAAAQTRNRATRRQANASDQGSANGSGNGRGGDASGFAFGHRPLSRSLGDAGVMRPTAGTNAIPHSASVNGSQLASTAPANASTSLAQQQQQRQRKDSRGAAASSAPPAGAAGAPAKAVIDQHLLALIQSVTSTASGVWVSLLDHLPAATSIEDGTGGSRSSTIFSPESARGILSPEATPTALTPQHKKGLASAGGAASLQPPSTDEDALRSAALSPTPSSSGGNASTRKLIDLRSQCLSASELTRRLQHTLEKVQDEMDAAGNSRVLIVNDNASPARHRLLEESVAFVRCVTSLLVTLRSLSVTHGEVLARVPDCKKSLAALTRGCANASVHLHFCAPGAASAGSGTAPASSGVDGGDAQRASGGG